MKNNTAYRNDHTGALARYVRTEYVPNNPDPIRVHVLRRYVDKSEGEEIRLNDESFYPHWSLMCRDNRPE